MSTIISCQSAIYAFDKDTVPVKSVPIGEPITIETYDCFTNQIQSPSDLRAINWEQINPATGPIFIEGAAPGDILKVVINKFDIGDQGTMVTGEGIGVLGDQFTDFDVKILPIKDDHAIFDEQMAIPLNKMIGVIGVAPDGDPIGCGTPGAHGGNLDTVLVKEGATLYCPVVNEGALFAAGDFHAAMGDGEVSGSGMEVPGEVTVTFNVIKEQQIAYPFLENEDHISVITTAETLDKATKIAVQEMIDIIHPHTDLTLSHLTMLMSAVGQTEISQVVNPLVTARFSVPKSVFESYGITLFSD